LHFAVATHRRSAKLKVFLPRYLTVPIVREIVVCNDFNSADDKDIGFVMGGIDGTNYRGQQFSFVHEWGRESIGNLLQWEQIRRLCAEGIQRYDMGSILEYKVRWTEIEIQTESIVLHPRIRRPREPRT
jgi:hypothetical protein